jgi:hypothetical protein
MRRFIAYAKYLLRHRRYVRKECWDNGLYWRGLVHDLSKFRPSEWRPYARHFYNRDGSHRKVRDGTGYYKPEESRDSAFDFAWLLHQKRNRHHWQWWILPKDDGGWRVLEMDEKSRLEMVCDWVGAGKAQGFVSPPDNPYAETRKWYSANRKKMVLGHNTRKWIEWKIGRRTHLPGAKQDANDES